MALFPRPGRAAVALALFASLSDLVVPRIARSVSVDLGGLLGELPGGLGSSSSGQSVEELRDALAAAQASLVSLEAEAPRARRSIESAEDGVSHDLRVLRDEKAALPPGEALAGLDERERALDRWAESLRRAGRAWAARLDARRALVMAIRDLIATLEDTAAGAAGPLASPLAPGSPQDIAFAYRAEEFARADMEAARAESMAREVDLAAAKEDAKLAQADLDAAVARTRDGAGESERALHAALLGAAAARRDAAAAEAAAASDRLDAARANERLAGARLAAEKARLAAISRGADETTAEVDRRDRELREVSAEFEAAMAALDGRLAEAAASRAALVARREGAEKVVEGAATEETRQVARTALQVVDRSIAAADEKANAIGARRDLESERLEIARLQARLARARADLASLGRVAGEAPSSIGREAARARAEAAAHAARAKAKEKEAEALRAEAHRAGRRAAALASDDPEGGRLQADLASALDDQAASAAEIAGIEADRAARLVRRSELLADLGDAALGGPSLRDLTRRVPWSIPSFSVRETLGDLARLRGWISSYVSEAPKRFRAFLAAPHIGVMGGTWVGLILVGLVLVLLVAGAAVVRARALARRLLSQIGGRAAPTYSDRVASAALRILHAHVAHAVVAGATIGAWWLFDIEDPGWRIVMYLAAGTLLLRLGLGLSREILSPARPEARLIQVGDAAAAGIHRFVTLLLAYTVLVIPATLSLEVLGFNRPLIESTWVVYQLGVAVIAVFILFKKHTIMGLLPPSEKRAVKLFYRVLDRGYPVVAIYLLAILAISLAGYRGLAQYLLRGTLGTLGVLALWGGALKLFGEQLARVLSPEDAVRRILPIEDRAAERAHGVAYLVGKWAIMAYLLIWIANLWGWNVSFHAIWTWLSIPLFTVHHTRISVASIVKIGLALVAAALVSRMLRRLLDTRFYPRTAIDTGGRLTINRILGYVVMTIGVLAGLSYAGFDPSSLAVFAGAIVIGAGIGLQKIAENFVSGLILMFERPVKPDDFIEVDGTLGTVVSIRTRSTIVNTRDNVSIIVPNHELITQRVVNWTHKDTRTRLHVSVGVAYGSDVPLVQRTLLDVARSEPRVLARPPPVVRFLRFGDSSLDFELLVWTDDPARADDLVSALHFAIDAAFREKGIQIPFPQRDVHVIPRAPEPAAGVEQPGRTGPGDG